jgi:hypothetical protein
MGRGGVARPRGLAAGSVVVVALALAGGTAREALAQASPTPAGPTIGGRVSGELVRDARIVFRIDVSSPGGYRGLNRILIVLSLHGVELEELVIDLDDGAILAAGGRALFGTANVLTGAFFEVKGLDVVTRTAGEDIGLTVRARLLQDVPEGARFELAVIDDEGASSSVSRRAILPEQAVDEGLSWGTLVAGVAGALLIGGFLGGLVGTRRKPTPRPSIYGEVRRRIDQSRRPSGR